jgi:hypothetical protein
MNGVPRHHHFFAGCCLFSTAIVLGCIAGAMSVLWGFLR